MSYFVRHNDYLTTAQASKFLNVTRFTVLNWIKEGKLQSACTFGGHQRIPRAVVLAARKQITSIHRVEPNPVQAPAVVHCWESKEIMGSKDKHQCNKCLVFKKKLNLCFLAVKGYGSLQVECQHDCMNCAFLAKHHPQERTMMRRRLKSARQTTGRGTSETGVNGILKKVLYNSGRLVATIGQLAAAPGPKRRFKRTSKKARKG